VEERGIAREQLVEGCELIKAGRLVHEVMTADQVVTY